MVLLKRLKLIRYALTLRSEELSEILEDIPDVIDFWETRRSYNPPPVEEPETFTVTVTERVTRPTFTIDEW